MRAKFGFSRVNFPEGTVKDGKVVDGSRLPLKTNRICKFVGTYYKHVGFRKSKRINECGPFKKFFLDYSSEYSAAAMSNAVDVITGGYDTSFPNLEQMSKPNEKQFTYEEILKGLKARSDIDLKLPHCRLPKREDIEQVPVKLEAFPGRVMSDFFGHDRGQVYRYSIPIAEDLYDMVTKRPLRDISFWSVGGREKQVKLTKTGQFRTRLILMPEDPQLRLGAIISNPITHGLKMLRRGGLFIGRTFESGHYRFFGDLLSGGNFVADCDWSKFDNYVYEELIIAAFGVLRSCFEDDERLDNLFLFIASGFVFKNVVLPDGLIYQISKGIPSGSPFTSLIGTVVNWLVWSTVLTQVGGQPNEMEKTRVVCCGDDTLLRLPDSFAIQDFDSVVQRSGLINDGVNSVIRPAVSTLHEFMPKFLKKRISGCGLPSWDAIDILNNMIHPPRDVKFIIKEEERAKMLLYIAPFNYNINKLINDYRLFCVNKLQEDKWYTEHFGIEARKNLGRSEIVAWTWFLCTPPVGARKFKSDDDWLYLTRRVVNRERVMDPAMSAWGVCAYLPKEAARILASAVLNQRRQSILRRKVPSVPPP